MIIIRQKWIILNYNLPTEPSRPRVAVWRRLKKLGAVNIQQSMWVLAYNNDNLSALQELSGEIVSNNGESLLMEGAFFDKEHEERVISLYNNIRNEEFKEFNHECEKFLKGLEKEISINNFTFPELEEAEEEYVKLLSWYKKIHSRDTFNSAEGNIAAQKLEQIKSTYDKYSNYVYKENN